MLSQATSEVKAADHPKEAMDMALIRLAYAASLPTPDDIAKKLEGAPLNRTPDSAPKPATTFDPIPGSSGADPNVKAIHRGRSASRNQPSGYDFGLEDERQMKLAADGALCPCCVVALAANCEAPKAGPTLPNTLSALLMKWTGITLVTLSDAAGATTLAEDEYSARKSAEEAALSHPLVQTAQGCFQMLGLLRLNWVKPKLFLSTNPATSMAHRSCSQNQS